MKYAVILFFVFLILDTSYSSESKKLQEFKVYGSYKAYPDGKDKISLSFFWSFINEKIPAKHFYVYVSDGRTGWKKIIDKNSFELTNHDLKGTTLRTKEIKFNLNDLTDIYLDKVSFLDNPQYTFYTIVNDVKNGYVDTAYVTFTFSEENIDNKNEKEEKSLSSVKELEVKPQVFPNPATDILYVPEDWQGKSAQIYDSNGAVVKTIINIGSNINVSDFLTGTYFIKSNGETAKFVIER